MSGTPLPIRSFLATEPNIGTRLSLSTWIVGFILIELVWTFLGGAVTFLVSEVTRNRPYSSASWTVYLIQHANFVVLLGTLVLFATKALRVSVLRFITDGRTFRWPLFRFALFVWFTGIASATLVTLVIEPHAILPNDTGLIGDRLLLMSLAVVLTPLQCLAEELLFRTMLWRMFALRIRAGWIIGMLSGAVFTLAHLTNVEVQSGGFEVLVISYYFLSGFLFMEMTRRHHGTEAAIGAHIANNLFLVLVVNYSGSSLPGDPWFIQQAPLIWLDLVVLMTCSWIIITYGSRYQ